uniref:Putative secreted peptide n=1 Tax=Anopheles braziliensis TaxID=58242 RepID=A0A2M3ZRQ0_9DIPT
MKAAVLLLLVPAFAAFGASGVRSSGRISPIERNLTIAYVPPAVTSDGGYSMRSGSSRISTRLSHVASWLDSCERRTLLVMSSILRLVMNASCSTVVSAFADRFNSSSFFNRPIVTGSFSKALFDKNSSLRFSSL